MNGYDKFIIDIKKLTKIDLSAYKEKQMKRRIESLMRRNEVTDFEDYSKLLSSSKTHLDQFLNHITINVSEFFRNPSQWVVLEKEILPEIISNKRRIKVWSSACATGEEPYSLAILFDKMGVDHVDILATDIDLKAIERAKTGVYSLKSLANMTEDIIGRYFIREGNQYTVKDKIKRKITFKGLDLLRHTFPQDQDLILCRNVMIYFTEEAKARLYHKFHDALAKNGIFFVGSTEQIIVPQEYGFSSVKSFFYKKI